MSLSWETIEPIFGQADDLIEQALDVENFNRQSAYNVAGYRPTRGELSQVPVGVTGLIPKDLEGAYLRNGTNTQFDKTHVRIHAFNGAGMLHQIQIRNGEATYSNTYIRTPRFQFEDRMGREVYLTLSDVAGGGRAALEKIRLIEQKKGKGLIPNFSTFEASPASTSVQYHSGKIYCLHESGHPFVLHPRLVNGRLILDGSGHLETWNHPSQGPFSAHPKIDPVNGDFYNMGSDRATNKIIFSHISGGALKNYACVYQQTPETGRMAYLHDYFLTENYLVFPDISIRFSEEGLLGQEGSCFSFDSNYKLRWGVVRRDFRTGDEVRWFETSRSGSLWHVVNAWEETSKDGGVRIVMYAPRFDSYPSDLPIHTPKEPPAKLNKWVLDLETGGVIEDRQLLGHGYERPTLNLAFVGKKNRYAYLLDEEKDGYMGKGVLKYDLLGEKEIKYFDYGEFYGGEALFVPRANAIDEDDGYLLELLMNDSKSEMIIIDAKSMNEVARLHLPQRVPFGVHACWLNEQKLNELIT
jgi:carotenoid cleavage dioxygenase-like enzyme